jgi:hypothetical protein
MTPVTSVQGLSRFSRHEAFLLLLCTPIFGQRGNPPIVSLKTVSVPQPTGLEQYIQDSNALIALGKALFWDMQVGSDGQTACARCTFMRGPTTGW